MRAYRRKKRLSQNQLADMIGVSRSLIATYETTDRNPSYEVYQKLKELFQLEDDPEIGRKQPNKTIIPDHYMVQALRYHEINSKL